MNLQDFYLNIDPIIVERGKAYFECGAVVNLEMITESTWNAEVEGTGFYDVTVELDDNEIVGWTCTCPYDWGPVCKHVVAVFYELAEELRTGSLTKINGSKKRQTKSEQLNELIKRISPNDLQNFVTQYALKNKQFSNDLIIQFSHLGDGSDTVDYKQIIRDIVRTGSDHFGLIDYQSSFNVMRTIDELLEKAEEFAQKSAFEESLQISLAIIEEIPEIVEFMDDSAGLVSDTFGRTCESIENIIPQIKPKSILDNLFHFLITESPKQKYHNYDFDSGLFYLLQQVLIDEEKERLYLALLDDMIETSQKQEDEWRTVDYLSKKIDFYQSKGRKDDAQRLIEENAQYNEFRKILVEQAIENKDLIRAEKLIIDGLKIAEEKQYWGNMNYWKTELLRIYELTNDTEKIRELAEELFFSGRYEMTYYKILKNTYPPDEWGKIRDRIIEKIRGGKKLIETYKVEAICNIHVEENQKEKLLKLLKLNETHLHLIDRFAFHLKNDYPEEILQLYRTAVNKFVERTGRSIYNQAVEYLKKMEKVKGGKAIVNKMVKNFKIVYNNRPAMMEILRENFSL